MGQDLGDFEIIEVTRVRFIRNGGPSIEYREKGVVSCVTKNLKNNAFLLNEDGNTIEAFFIRQQGR